MPPASSHFADKPVPAPPPTIGWPRRTMSWKASIRTCRSMRGISGLGKSFTEMGRERGGECVVVDGVRQPRDLAPRGRPQDLFDGREQDGVRFRIMERLSGR